MFNIFSIRSLSFSSIYLGYLIFLHIFAYVCAAVVLPDSLYVIVLFCLMMSFLFYLEKDQKIISLEYAKKNEWILYDCNQRAVRMQLLPSSVMMRYFLILYFVRENTSDKKTVVLFSDMFSQENYRHLRRCVRMGYL